MFVVQILAKLKQGGNQTVGEALVGPTPRRRAPRSSSSPRARGRDRELGATITTSKDSSRHEVALDDRTVAVAIAKRQLFVLAVLREATPALIARVDELRDRVADMLDEAEPHDRPPPSAGRGRGGGGGGGGAAELQLVELGITMPRVRPKA